MESGIQVHCDGRVYDFPDGANIVIYREDPVLAVEDSGGKCLGAFPSDKAAAYHADRGTSRSEHGIGSIGFSKAPVGQG